MYWHKADANMKLYQLCKKHLNHKDLPHLNVLENGRYSITCQLCGRFEPVSGPTEASTRDQCGSCLFMIEQSKRAAVPEELKPFTVERFEPWQKRGLLVNTDFTVLS